MRLYSRFAEHVVLPAGDLALRTEFTRTLRRMRRTVGLPASQLDALQAAALADLLQYATTTVPHYRSMVGGDPRRPHDWLRAFPVLTKLDLRDAADDLVVGPRDRLVASPSSGSSGVQSTVYMTPRESSRSQAYQTLLWEWAGYHLGEPLLQTGMTPERGVVKRAKDRLLRTTYVEAFGVDDERAVAVLSSPGARRSRYFGGYASSLFVFARAARRAGLDVPRFESVISWGDKMFPEYRALVEETFSTRVHDTYGTTEGLVIAGQRELDQYYVLSPHVVVELLDDAGAPVAPGQLGQVVVTRLDSRAMPLIRYALGDLAVAGEPPPEADLDLPVIERIVGRDTDIVETPAGRHLIVHTFTGIFEFFEEVQQFRVVQRDPGGITIEVVPGPGFGAHVLEQLERRLRDVVDEPLAIDFAQVDHIPSTPSGKPQIIQSLLRQPHRPRVSDSDGDAASLTATEPQERA